MDISITQTKYKNNCLYKKDNSAVREELCCVMGDDDAQKFFEEVDAWLKQCRELVEEACAAARAGERRDGFAFDSFQKRAMALGANVKTYLRQQFDRAVEEQITFPTRWCFPKTKPGERPESHTSDECMYQYCFFGVQERESEQQEELAKYLRFGGTELQRDDDRHFADQWVAAAKRIYDSIKFGSNWSDLNEKIRQLGGPLVYLCNKKKESIKERRIRKDVKKKHQVRITPTPAVPKLQQSIEVTLQPRTLSANAWAHPNEISQLPPAREWVLYIDESYVVKENCTGDESFCTGGDGVIAGVLFDRSKPLPPQPQLHASQDVSEELMTKADQVIDILTRSSCGVLALPVSACKSAQGWGSMIGAYLDIVLRLLPISDEPCTLSVFIEERDPYHSNRDCQFLRDACCYRLMQSLPERAQKIKLSLAIQSKSDPYNAYPDIVAHCCRMHRHEHYLAAPRFNASGWDGSCFLSYRARFLAPLLDAFHAGTQLKETDWQILLRENKKRPSGFVSAILQTVGCEARADVRVWRRYLKFVLTHLNSKNVNLMSLSAQIDWLKANSPADAELPPRLRLLWLTAKLAEANHRGRIIAHGEQRDEFRKLCFALFEEDAPLVCEAVLNLAVSHTNEFDFEGARAVLSEWKDYKPEVFGLQKHGRLLSGLGQCEAFLGNEKEAVRLFMAALADFRKLSEQDSASLDCSQTMAYLVTVLMDSAIPRNEGFDKAAYAYWRQDLCSAAKLLSCTNSDDSKYAHHILLRYLTSPLARESEVEAYLSEKSNWLSGDGHPWEMISFYRAFLCDDPEEKLEHLEEAAEIAPESGEGVLLVIAALIEGARMLLDPTRETVYRELVSRCIAELPLLGERGNILLDHIDKKYEPLELARLVLPFNFR